MSKDEKLIPDRFVMYGSFYKSISKLSEQEQSEVFKALFKYAFEGIETEFDGLPSAIFDLIMPSLRTQRKNWLNGIKGGRPKQDTNPPINPNDNPLPNQNNELNDEPTAEPKSEPIGDRDKYLSIRDKDKDLNTKNIVQTKPLGHGDDEPIETENPFLNRFKIFWSHYPRKEGKGKAEEWFKKKKPSAKLLDHIIDSIEIQKKSKKWTKDDGQFIPMPATWLNQKRWEDELALSVDKNSLYDEDDENYEPRYRVSDEDEE